jgi:hypothetical protein
MRWVCMRRAVSTLRIQRMLCCSYVHLWLNCFVAALLPWDSVLDVHTDIRFNLM